MQIEVSQQTDANIDGLEPLWRAMLDHHRSVTKEQCHATLRERGVSYWAIDFLADNDGAGRLYERLGFTPWRHTLLAPLRP